MYEAKQKFKCHLHCIKLQANDHKMMQKWPTLIKFKTQTPKEKATYRSDNDMAGSFFYVTQRIVWIDPTSNLQTAWSFPVLAVSSVEEKSVSFKHIIKIYIKGKSA